MSLSGFFIYEGEDKIVGAVIIKEINNKQVFMYTPITEPIINPDFAYFATAQNITENDPNVYDINVLNEFMKRLFPSV
jgi:hypothetical protein